MKIEKVKKLITNSDNKNEYVIHIKNLKQALTHKFELFKRYFKYSCPSDMYKALNETKKLRRK